MWKSRRNVVKQIRAKQREMYRLAKSKGVADLDVYNKSCELDELIVEYMKKYGNVNKGSLFRWHDSKEKEGV